MKTGQSEKTYTQVYKTCSTCEVTFSIEMFLKRIDRKSGRRSQCKFCFGRSSAASKKRYYEKNKQHHFAVMRERYHKIQEEAGCHMKVRVFYPAYRIIKALETAQVVEA